MRAREDVITMTISLICDQQYEIIDKGSSKYDHYGSCMRGRERPKPAAASSSLPKSLSKSSIANIDLDINRQERIHIHTNIIQLKVCSVSFIIQVFFYSRKQFSWPNGLLLPKSCYAPQLKHMHFMINLRSLS